MVAAAAANTWAPAHACGPLALCCLSHVSWILLPEVFLLLAQARPWLMAALRVAMAYGWLGVGCVTQCECTPLQISGEDLDCAV